MTSRICTFDSPQHCHDHLETWQWLLPGSASSRESGELGELGELYGVHGHDVPIACWFPYDHGLGWVPPWLWTLLHFRWLVQSSAKCDHHHELANF